jgi:hypothetical protein
MVGSFESGRLYGLITSLEANGVAFQLVEAAGSVYVGVGQPDVWPPDSCSSDRGPRFISSGFLVAESLQVRTYPVVLVAGRVRLLGEV